MSTSNGASSLDKCHGRINVCFHLMYLGVGSGSFCCWCCNTNKHGYFQIFAQGTLDHYRAVLAKESFTQTYGIHNLETLCMACLNYIRDLFPIAVNRFERDGHLHESTWFLFLSLYISFSNCFFHSSIILCTKASIGVYSKTQATTRRLRSFVTWMETLLYLKIYFILGYYFMYHLEIF